MTSQKPYLIRAIYEWLLDNQQTPYLFVNAEVEGVQVPQEYVKDGKIVLNIDPGAVRNFQADNEWISFSARFSGRAMDLFIPVQAVESIYGKESQQGMLFPSEPTPPAPEPPKPQKKAKTTTKPGLKLVK